MAMLRRWSNFEGIIKLRAPSLKSLFSLFFGQTRLRLKPRLTD
jgi:hypothetical protein